MTRPESNLRAAFEQLVFKAIEIGINEFGDNGLPTFEHDATWAKQTAPHSYTYETERSHHANWHAFWERCQESLQGSPEWEVATTAFQVFEDSHGGESADDMPSFQVSEFFLENYFDDVGDLQFDEGRFSDVMEELIRRAKSESTFATTLIALENTKISNSFELAPGIQLRPIEAEELAMFGQGLRPISRFMRDIPHDDWWVVRLSIKGAKGTYESWNANQHDSMLIGPAFRIFKAGSLTFRYEAHYHEDRFSAREYGRGRSPHVISQSGSAYSLTDTEIGEFKAMWPPFKSLMDDEHHYLQLPVRRLLSGGDRPNLEDSLVDYVIGLESLLLTSGGELSFRFSVRGAVILSDNPGDRPDNFKSMRDLYGLRSNIVHGDNYNAGKLTASIEFAESALRKCWWWYFEKWSGETNNGPANTEIDRQLFLI